MLLSDKSQAVRPAKTIKESIKVSRQETKPPICLPPYWPWFSIIAVLPFIGAVLVLGFVAPTELDTHLFADAFAKGGSARIGHLGDRFIYATLTYVQLASTMLVTIFYMHRIYQLDPARKSGAIRLLGVTAFCAAMAVVVVRALKVDAYAVTYRNIRDLLQHSEVTHDFTMPFFSFDAIPYLAEVTPISLAAGIPFLMGAIAIVFAVPVGAAAASFPSNEQVDWNKEFAARVHWLQQAFYALSIVLVTSTVSLMLFFQLPAEIALDAYQGGLLRYARGLTMFWGATMTLTLLAAFTPAILELRRCAREQHGTVASHRDFGEWFSEQVPTTARRQLANLATMLAPLMVGPLGGLLQAMFVGG